jgi:hypothetical protein
MKNVRAPKNHHNKKQKRKDDEREMSKPEAKN